MNTPFTELPINIPGVRLFEPRVFRDPRGDFVKTFHKEAYAGLGIQFVLAEQFYSVSKKNVLRGMHFQLPPHDHAKLVYCVAGRVLDVLLDLRKDSPNFGKSIGIEMGVEDHRILYIPSGLAHGFLSLEDQSLMIYQTSAIHAPCHDVGIHWDSFGFKWPVQHPIVSTRDAAFQPLVDFTSPF
ncbi:MAG: dTDP-4-dehydrorhamnose 3,5-epimerase [Candidatus Didemnitutus sp.]|nr:dTDP-4-dehydrorhamnose 3,5-epimerase [Candidatus Didemnitutus sp.]